MCDFIEEPWALAFQWMDDNLRTLRYESVMHSYPIITAVMQQLLGGCAVLCREGLVDTGNGIFS